MVLIRPAQDSSSRPMYVLLVEDDAVIAKSITRNMATLGHSVAHVVSAEQAWAALTTESFDLAIVDLGLPGEDGMGLLQRVRRHGNKVPVIIITARDSVPDRVDALDLGADDYLVKPFALPELVARCRAVLRRQHAMASSEVMLGALRLDLAGRSAELDSQPLKLTRREWLVLECLALHAGRIVRKEHLLGTISGWDRDLTANSVESLVSRLRNKLGNALNISTLRGLGYRLDDPGE
jgi:DNA-binding response OmpR family regulator